RGALSPPGHAPPPPPTLPTRPPRPPHPPAPLAAPPPAADLAVVAWLDFLRIDPAHPVDPAGDRLILGGPGSADLADALARLVGAAELGAPAGGDGVLGEAVGMAWGARALSRRGAGWLPPPAPGILRGAPIPNPAAPGAAR